MAKNNNLHKAKAAKNDEFYTRLEDIEAEISSNMDYVRQFEGKTVLCCADDPEYSQFFTFFKNHFIQLKIKKLITTHYIPPEIKTELQPVKDKKGNIKKDKDGNDKYEEVIVEEIITPSYMMVWEGETLNDDMVGLDKIPLKGNGDFRDDEIKDIMKQYGEELVVCTNPPFSLFREFMAQIEEFGCKFAIIGNKNAITYKEFFPLIKENKVVLGYTSAENFLTAEGETKKVNGLTRWFTNFDLDKSHEALPLTKNYKGNEDRYPRYDNYDAINCDKVSDIPKDYEPCWYSCPYADKCKYAESEGREDDALCESEDFNNNFSPCNGEVGVPITYMDKHNSEQFEIVGADTDLANDVELEDGKKGTGRFYLDDGRADTHTHTHTHTTQETVQQNYHQKDQGSVTELSESPSHSSISIAQNNLEFSGLIDTLKTTQDTDTASTSAEKKCTQEYLFKKCNGLIGVPITFLDVCCPDQFELVGLSSKEHAGAIPRMHNNAFYNGYTRGKVITRVESNMPLLNVAGIGGTKCCKPGLPDIYQLYWRLFIRVRKENKQNENTNI